MHHFSCKFSPRSILVVSVGYHIIFNDSIVNNYINSIHHGWSVEIGKSQPEGPSVPVGNEARRVSHWNDGTEG